MFGNIQRSLPASLYLPMLMNFVQVSDPARQTLFVSRVIVHSNYNPRGQDSDIALFRLARRLTLNTYVHPICLPRWNVPATIKCVVTGWGQTHGERTLVMALSEITIHTTVILHKMT